MPEDDQFGPPGTDLVKDTMSSYIDPATALQSRLARAAKPRGGDGTAKPRRRLWARPTFTRPAIAH